MAQKSKAAAQPARGGKDLGKKSKTKAAAKQKKPLKAKAAALEAKKATAKVGKPTRIEKPEKVAAGDSKDLKNIKLAKAALKKESESAQAPAEAPTKRSRKISIEISANEAASALAQKWGTLYKKAEQIEAKPYNMKAQFEEKTAIVHKVLGWGYILANRNDRLEVLFKDGIKYLISNYKP